MRILHVITGLGQGGAENALAGLCRDMKRIRVDVRVVSLGGGSEKIMDFNSAGIEAVSLAKYSLTEMLGQLRLHVRDFAPDVVHCWMYHPILLAPFFVQDVPFIAGIRASLQSLHTEKLATRVVIRACALTSRRAGAIVYNSTVAAIEHEGIGYTRKNRLVIPNGFNLKDFEPSSARRKRARRNAGIDKDEFVIGHAGRFHSVKNQIGLIGAAGMLMRSGRQFRLVLAGTLMDARNEQLRAAILQAGIENHVILLGIVMPITDMLDLCDLIVSASIGEAFPNIVAEAMAMAIPVVATNAGDSASIIGDAGCIARSSAPEDLACAIDSVLGLRASERIAIGTAGRKRIADNYSQNAITNAYFDLYRATARQVSWGE